MAYMLDLHAKQGKIESQRAKIFDVIISLGSNCTIAQQLRMNFLSTFRLPFDWLITPDVTMVQRLIENRFEGFIMRENLEFSLRPNYEKAVVFDKGTRITFMHDFPKIDNPIEIAYDYVSEKYQRRCFLLCEMLHTGKRCLFIRRRSGNDTLEDCIALGRYLRKFNKDNMLWIINPEEAVTPKSEKAEDGIIVWNISHLSDHIHVTDLLTPHWIENSGHWNAMLADIYLASTRSLKMWFEQQVSILIDYAGRSQRSVIFWGGGNNARLLLPYFTANGIMPRIYDRNKQRLFNPMYQRVWDQAFLRNRDYYVIVTPADHEDIVRKLEENNYRENIDYSVASLIHNSFGILPR